MESRPRPIAPSIRSNRPPASPEIRPPSGEGMSVMTINPAAGSPDGLARGAEGAAKGI
jgi:hypothetical protein